MKKNIIVGLCVSTLLVAGVSALTDASMSMTKDSTMMSQDGAMMAKKYSAMNTVSLVKSLGYNWKKDRAGLALKAGITGYTGTAKQNLKIRAYLMAHMQDMMASSDTSSNGSMQKDDTMKKDDMMKDTTTAMAPAETGVMVGGAMMVPSKDIVDNAVGSSDHTTLVAAVKAAGLVDTLKGAGPFTVFAPTNEAFAKLPAGTVESLVKPENKATLTNILTYHVVAGRYTSADLKDGMTLKTVEGDTLTFSKKDGKWWINGVASIEIPDVISSNGVTFVIDTVLMPSSK